MKKWTTVLIGLVLLLVGAGSAWAGGRTEEVVVRPQVPADWHLAKVPSGEPRFSLWLPSGWQLNELQGIDSIVGEIVGEGVWLGFDFGWYSSSLAGDADALHAVTYEEIGGRLAKLVQPKAMKEGGVGVYFEDFDGTGEDSSPPFRLTIGGRGLTPEQQETAFTIFRSVRGLDSEDPGSSS